MHTYTPANSIFDGPIATRLSILCILVEVLSPAHAKREESHNDFKFASSIGRFQSDCAVSTAVKGLRITSVSVCSVIIIIYIYHALINALSAHMIHINLNMIFYTHVEHSPTKTIYIKYYRK